MAKVLGDAKGRTVSGLHKDGRVFNLRLEVQEMKDEGQTKRLFSGRITLDASDILDRRCCKLKMSDDGDIITLTEGAEDLFGISVNDIVGFPIEELLRWPDGSTENILECLLAIPSHTRVPGAAVTARGKLIDGTSPPVVTMMVPIAGDSKNLTKARGIECSVSAAVRSLSSRHRGCRTRCACSARSAFSRDPSQRIALLSPLLPSRCAWRLRRVMSRTPWSSSSGARLCWRAPCPSMPPERSSTCLSAPQSSSATGSRSCSAMT